MRCGVRLVTPAREPSSGAFPDLRGSLWTLVLLPLTLGTVAAVAHVESSRARRVPPSEAALVRVMSDVRQQARQLVKRWQAPVAAVAHVPSAESASETVPRVTTLPATHPSLTRERALQPQVWHPEPARLHAAIAALRPASTQTSAQTRLLAYHFNARLFQKPQADAQVRGIVRRGTVLSSLRLVSGTGCAKGRWHEVQGGGYACTSDGFMSGRDFRDSRFLNQRPPDLQAALPYRYAWVVRQGAPRFHEAHDDEGWLREVSAREVQLNGDGVERLVGDYLLAIDRLESRRESDHVVWFYRTIRGRYVRPSDVQLFQPTQMAGALLGELRLPLAFVKREVRALPCVLTEGQGPLPRCEAGGAAPTFQRYDRLPVSLSAAHPKQVVLKGGYALPRDAVAVARRRVRPAEVGPSDKWIHVALGSQTLVAYEGSRPVFATLIASGKKGYETPRGTFRVREKYVSITMNATDPIDGYYEVEEVPWVMYYWRSFALHGAYWHDDFGAVRSHGCTNIPPLDAKWLYHWTTPRVPEGWHGRHGSTQGTQVVVTR